MGNADTGIMATIDVVTVIAATMATTAEAMATEAHARTAVAAAIGMDEAITGIIKAMNLMATADTTVIIEVIIVIGGTTARTAVTTEIEDIMVITMVTTDIVVTMDLTVERGITDTVVTIGDQARDTMADILVSSRDSMRMATARSPRRKFSNTMPQVTPTETERSRARNS